MWGGGGGADTDSHVNSSVIIIINIYLHLYSNERKALTFKITITHTHTHARIRGTDTPHMIREITWRQTCTTGTCFFVRNSLVFRKIQLPQLTVACSATLSVFELFHVRNVGVTIDLMSRSKYWSASGPSLLRSPSPRLPHGFNYDISQTSLLYRLSLICFWHLRTLSKNRTNERTGYD